MPALTEQRRKVSTQEAHPASKSSTRAIRINSEDLFQQQHEVEIAHQGRIYRLRRTQLNKLILTA